MSRGYWEGRIDGLEFALGLIPYDSPAKRRAVLHELDRARAEMGRAER